VYLLLIILYTFAVHTVLNVTSLQIDYFSTNSFVINDAVHIIEGCMYLTSGSGLLHHI